MQSLATLQTWLDEAGTATVDGDWEAYRARIALPFLLVTETQSIVVASETELRRGFDQFREVIQTLGVAQYVRLGETSAEIGPGLISGRYVTHMLTAGGQRVVPPFRSNVTLRQDGPTWRAASIANALRNTQWPIGVPDVATHSDGRRDPP